MRKQILLILFMFLVAGAFSFADAQSDSRLKTANEVTPTWTAKGTFYGFLTCDKIQDQGSKASVDAIKKCIAEGGRYYFGEPNINRDAAAQAKLAPLVGKFVAVNVTMTAARYGTGPTSDAAVEGLPSGGDRPTPRRLLWNVVSVTVDPTPDPRTGEPRSGDRGAAAAE